MNRVRVDRAVLVTARQVENLAELLPQLRDHVADLLGDLDSLPTQVPGAVEPAVLESRSKALSGRCSGAVGTVDGFVVDCGRLRPCAEHDFPVSLTPVERVAEQRLRLERELADAEQRVRTIDRIANEVLADARRLLGTRPPTADRCTGGIGREGYMEWGDPTCSKVPAWAGGICDSCRGKEYRWRKTHGLAARETGAA